jgi:anti-anti-sigma factor
MNFVEQKIGDVLVVGVNLARATLQEADSFKQLLFNAMEKGERKIVVDFSQCDFVDSTFLGALVVSLKRMTQVGGDIKLVGFRPAVRSMMELTRMHKVFDCYETVQDAVKSFE